ncbi:MAG: anthranilate phosphoribosyltransferase [Acidobacteriota bacterium]
MDFKATLNAWLAGESVTRETTERLFGELMDGSLSEVQKTALMVALATKGEAAEEIAGAASAMRARSTKILHRLERVVDTCGTGGSGQATFNVSTASAIVAAAAGVPVAKHGNRAVSSRSGSADVLGELGVSLELTPEQAADCLAEVGLAFLFAPNLHPAMREVMPIRRELGVRTVFNVLGPLTNPAGARRQVLGVFDGALVPVLGRVLAQLGCDHALVVHGADGLDEITTTGATTVAEVRGEKVDLYEIAPGDFGFEEQASVAFAGGEPAQNAARFEALLAGQDEDLAPIVAANAGAAIYVGGAAPTLADGVRLAHEKLNSGEAAPVLDRLRSFGAGS